jgi:hypothetical protein
MTHAGFHPGLINAPTVKKILIRCEKAIGSAERRIVDPILGAGKDRGGPQEFGGPLWLDFGSFVPIPQINQLVGHTPGRRARESNTANSRNYCIDVRNASAAAILCDEKLTILTKE